MRIGAIEHPLTWVTTYADVMEGEGLLHVDSYGQIAVAVRTGRAVDDYPLEDGIAVTFRRADATEVEIQSVKPVV